MTLDSPFNARVIPDIALHNISNNQQQLMIEVHIVDTASGLIRGLRTITMPPSMTIEFLSAVQDQLVQFMMLSPFELSKKTTLVEMGRTGTVTEKA